MPALAFSLMCACSATEGCWAAVPGTGDASGLRHGARRLGNRSLAAGRARLPPVIPACAAPPLVLLRPL